MSVCLTAIPVRRRRTQLPRSKETLYRSTLRDLQREIRTHYRWPHCHPRGAGICNLLRQGLRNEILKVLEIKKNNNK